MTVKPASLDQLSNFSVDSAGHLYWNGHEVVTTLALPWWVQVATVVGAFAGLIAAVWPVAKYFLDWLRLRRSNEIS